MPARPHAVADRIRAVVGDAPAYLSFDVDALDPAFAPGTGTPEIGGLATWQVQAILRRLAAWLRGHGRGRGRARLRRGGDHRTGRGDRGVGVPRLARARATAMSIEPASHSENA